MRAITDAARDPWINGRQAARIIGCSPSALHRAALIGEIRAQVVPGSPPRYHRLDCERIAAGKASSRAAQGAGA
jgi:hypothetical protein